MKKTLFSLFILLWATGAYSQNIKLSNFYTQRELNAPKLVRDNLAAIRKDITTRNLKYVVGYTSVADVPIEKITGAKQITQEEEVKIREIFRQASGTGNLSSRISNTTVQKQAIKVQRLEPANPYPFGDPLQSSLDLRKSGFVTPVRNQGWWGSCWAFSAMAAYESSYKMLGEDINTSEEFIVNCSKAGDWSGGWPHKVFQWMVYDKKNVASETSIPYTGPSNCTGVTPSEKYYALEYGWADMTSSLTSIAKVQQIKEKLCKYGAISTCLYADDNFKLYAGGYFFSFKSTTSLKPYINHAVAIIGWDDSTQCWLIKNSWGNGWGSECDFGTEKGYMWIKYDANNVGASSIWIQASGYTN